MSMDNVYIPVINLYPSPIISKGSDLAEDSEDWHIYLTEIFEWIGMASLHSPRYVVFVNC